MRPTIEFRINENMDGSLSIVCWKEETGVFSSQYTNTILYVEMKVSLLLDRWLSLQNQYLHFPNSANTSPLLHNRSPSTMWTGFLFLGFGVFHLRCELNGKLFAIDFLRLLSVSCVLVRSCRRRAEEKPWISWHCYLMVVCQFLALCLMFVHSTYIEVRKKNVSIRYVRLLLTYFLFLFFAADSLHYIILWCGCWITCVRYSNALLDQFFVTKTRTTLTQRYSLLLRFFLLLLILSRVSLAHSVLQLFSELVLIFFRAVGLNS